MEEKRFLTIHDASRLWHIEAEELRRRCGRGRIKGAKQVRGIWLIRSRGLPRGCQSCDKVRFRPNTDCRKNDGFSTV